MKEHETRAMLDGQIHDIGRVGRTIAEVKAELEGQLEAKLTDVCIAAAGRVLKTVTTSVEYEFAEETVVTAEHIHTLDLLGVDHAQQILKERNDTRYKFYCCLLYTSGSDYSGKRKNFCKDTVESSHAEQTISSCIGRTDIIWIYIIW